MPVAAKLEARSVGVHFEGLKALDNVDLTLQVGEILGLIGPNGAGKTTLVNVLSGYQKPSAGTVHLAGADTSGWPAHCFARAGLARTFQAARLFPGMSVLENVEMAGVGTGRGRAQSREAAEKILSFLGLSHRAGIAAQALSYGEERLVGIGRALALNPSFMLLDEPAAGVSPQEAQDLMHTIARIRDEYGCGILVIEHNIQLIMRLCDRVHVLARGETIAEGRPDDVRADAKVREAYLGTNDNTGTIVAGARRQDRSTARPVLSISDLIVDYGPVRALAGVSISVREGEFVSVVGPNGAGKSTLLAAITGLVRHASGTIEYDGRKLGRDDAADRAMAGIALVPEGRRILSNLTVEENLRVGQTTRRRDSDAAERFDEILERFPILRERRHSYAGKLSGGEQQQLAIARALLGKPRLLLLDEPSLGLAPAMIDQVYAILTGLHEDGMTILLMEQNANRALLAAERAYVLRHATIELEGTAEELGRDPAFDKAYFGFDTASNPGGPQ